MGFCLRVAYLFVPCALQEKYSREGLLQWEAEQRRQTEQELQDMELAAQAQAQFEQEVAEVSAEVNWHQVDVLLGQEVIKANYAGHLT
jgi:hypothetical protein